MENKRVNKSVIRAVQELKDKNEREERERQEKLSKFTDLEYTEVRLKDMLNDPKYNLVVAKYESELRNESYYGIIPEGLVEPLKYAINEYYKEISEMSFPEELEEFSRLMKKVIGEDKEEKVNRVTVNYEDLKTIEVRDNPKIYGEEVIINGKIRDSIFHMDITVEVLPILKPNNETVYNNLMERIKNDKESVNFYRTYLEDGIKRMKYKNDFRDEVIKLKTEQ